MTKVWLIPVFMLALVGCASTATSGSAVQPPEWYEKRQAELTERGFPRIADMPTLPERQTAQDENVDPDSKRAKDLAARRRTALWQAMIKDPRSAPTYLTPQEIAAWGDEQLSRLEGQPGPADFLTDQEVASLRARFDRRRARR
ncbi:hypothetical protein D1224_10980 [Henriciella barbarensis]|uniref:DUF3035 domain-containing protein n=2 Tax=Henriciella barbarensis TaxID=86342 RepID=A0A399QV24_9PROT|nr:hypothetical protein D1224_10980 [Henriciella barbarensis]